MSSQCVYSNDKREGEYKSWRENGQLWMQHAYLNGKRKDTCKVWGKDGQLLQI